MSSNSFLNSIPASIFSSVDHNVAETQFGQRFAANPQRNTNTSDIFKAVDWIEANKGKFRSATVVTCAGERLIFSPDGFNRLDYPKPSKSKQIPEFPFTPVELTTGIEDLSVPLESLPMRKLTELFIDDRGDYLQCDSHGYIYRNNKLSYRVTRTSRGFYCDIEQSREWFFENRHYSGYREEIHAHREALWIMKGEPLFYRPQIWKQ